MNKRKNYWSINIPVILRGALRRSRRTHDRAMNLRPPGEGGPSQTVGEGLESVCFTVPHPPWQAPSPQGRRCPSGRMRGGGKHGSQDLTHRLRRFLLTGGRGFKARSWILRLRLKAPRRMTALLVGSKNQMGMMGWFSPVSSGADSSHLTLPACIPQRIQG